LRRCAAIIVSALVAMALAHSSQSMAAAHSRFIPDS
jgi:hypothetical protein